MEELLKEIKLLFYVTFIYEDRWLFFLQGFIMTIILTLFSFLFGSIIGALFAKGMLSKKDWLSKIITKLVSFIIQLPTLVILMIFVYVLFSNVPLSVTIIVLFGLTLKASAYLAEIFYTAVCSVSKGEIDAAYTLGLSNFQVLRYIILPQAIDNALPIYKSQFVITLQETSIVGYLAIVDLTRASEIVTARTLSALFSLFVISVLYLIIGKVGTALLGLFSHKKHLKEDEIL